MGYYPGGLQSRNVQDRSESKRYLKALSDVYDKIFEFNLDADTIKCLRCEETSYFKRFENIAMRIEDALTRWLINSVSSEDQDAVRRFFADFCQKRLSGTDGRPPQITYKARSTDRSFKQYTGVFIKADESVSFYCCREVKETAKSEALKEENDQLKEGMRIEHNKFGFGKILEISGPAADLKAKISFDDYGEKILLLKYAKIRTI